MKLPALVLFSSIVALGACQSPRQAPPGPSTPTTAAPAAPQSAALSTATATEPSSASVAGVTRDWAFDADADKATPGGFLFGRTGTGNPGRWVVQAEADAPSKPNVLAQLDTDDTDYRFPIAVAAEPVLRDVRVSVHCKMVGGKVDQACGLVARYLDENNYYVTRANALENNVRLYIVHNGKRKQFESWSGKVTPNTWHEYRFEIRGDRLEVWWDGQKLLEHHDSTFADAGRAGVWTKADSVTYFDDLKIEVL